MNNTKLWCMWYCFPFPMHYSGGCWPTGATPVTLQTAYKSYNVNNRRAWWILVNLHTMPSFQQPSSTSFCVSWHRVEYLHCWYLNKSCVAIKDHLAHILARTYILKMQARCILNRSSLNHPSYIWYMEKPQEVVYVQVATDIC